MGPDNIHPRVLKEAAEVLSTPLASIFTKSFRAGLVPGLWKLGRVAALHKKGDRKLPNNYRPVSLTCILCKLMESFVSLFVC